MGARSALRAVFDLFATLSRSVQSLPTVWKSVAHIGPETIGALPDVPGSKRDTILVGMDVKGRRQPKRPGGAARQRSSLSLMPPCTEPCKEPVPYTSLLE